MVELYAGAGRITLASDGTEAFFSELSCVYPLKLLSPRIAQENTCVVYVLTYGGGLVGGDRISLDGQVNDGATLVMLSQGSTKVFKDRPGFRASARHHGTSSTIPTTQRLDMRIASGSMLCLLPDPVTCFRAAKYNQVQIFRLEPGASLVLLDWVTSGRKSIGEDWVFDRYYSLNEVWIGDRRVAKDAMLLQEQEDVPPLTPRTLAQTLKPYSCYATLIMYGPSVQGVMQDLRTKFNSISLFKLAAPADLIWSFTSLEEGQGSVVRVAARETEAVKVWIGDALRLLEHAMGVDVYRRAFH